MSAKVVIVGDGAIGKSCLIQELIQNPDAEPIDWTNPQYVPTAADNQSVEWTHENENGNKEDYTLEIWDTAGQEALKNLRAMSYPDTDIFMIGFDMTKRDSLENIIGVELSKADTITPASFTSDEGDDDDEEKAACWMKELKSYCEADFKIILLGTKCDLWEIWKNDPEHSEQCIKWEEGYNVAKAIGATMFISTSAKTVHGIRPVADGGTDDTELLDEGVNLKDWMLKLVSCEKNTEPVPELPAWPKPVKAPTTATEPVATETTTAAATTTTAAATTTAPAATTTATTTTTAPPPAAREPAKPAAKPESGGGCCTVQ